ncbi:hypothetical protein Pint_27416 [Pistacia integerrima]|uniref:Uncharacterized protein n=1 Tax=Pistacia integerrima TaxID=434235 RepID=A0ACC0YUF1_9ROSI|nr:hypothetical protein Pint_27416 [Pistacia integerrima]
MLIKILQLQPVLRSFFFQLPILSIKVLSKFNLFVSSFIVYYLIYFYVLTKICNLVDDIRYAGIISILGNLTSTQQLDLLKIYAKEDKLSFLHYQ